MLYKLFAEKLLGLQGVEIEKIEETENSIHIYCKLERKAHYCPTCSATTNKIHDYHKEKIKDISDLEKEYSYI